MTERGAPLGSWNRVYVAVLAIEVAVMALLWAAQRYWS
jgi:hypothetical protein